jgi:hypothetical protein
MTRLLTTHTLPSSPPSVLLGELAIAAGVAGFPVTLCYQEFPAPELSQVWKHHIRCVEPDEVYHIHTQRNLDKLPGRLAEVRIVLVHTPRLHIPTAWSIQLMSPVDAEGGPCAAMLSRFVPDDLDEEPGATVVLRGSVQEIAAIGRWLATGGNADRDRLLLPGPMSVELPAWLSSVLSPDSRPNGRGRRRLRDLQVLRGLLAGACVLRSARDGDEAVAAGTVSRDDYESVRRLLQSPILLPADAACDPLATDMIKRANVYLAARSGEVRRCGSPLLGHDCEIDNEDGRQPRELITRREVADLGNVQSSMVRRLVEYLRQGADGYQWYCRMGLVRRPPGRDAWSTTSPASLVANLRPWSLKQVRTHFDRLRREGLITAEREHGNGPWRYALPEELADGSSPFHNMPPVEQLVPEPLTSNDAATR